jgi:tRNA threonylcarbamoyladenosine biosynthesis protein TsaB
MEAYTAVFKAGKQIGDISAEIITEESFKAYWESDKTVLIGNCVEKCKTVLNHANIDFIEAVPSAKYMIGLAYQKYITKEFVDVAYFEPYYLKDFVAGKPKKLL